MAELNKTSKGVRLNGEGSPKRDPVIAEIGKRVLKDNGSTVTAKFKNQREGYVSGYKMNGTSQKVTDSRVDYYSDETKSYRNLIKVVENLFKFGLIFALLILAVTYAIGLSTTGSLEGAKDYVEEKTREVPGIGELYKGYEESLTNTELEVGEGIFPEVETSKDDIYESSNIAIPDGDDEVVLTTYTLNIPEEHSADFMNKPIHMAYHNTDDIIFFLKDLDADPDELFEVLYYHYTLYEDQANIQEFFLPEQKGILDYALLMASEYPKAETLETDYMDYELQWSEDLDSSLTNQGFEVGIVVEDAASMNATLLLNLYYTLNEVYEELIIERGGY